MIDSETMLPLRHPCHCGSGKKYKNCCADKDPVINTRALFRRESRKPGTIQGMIEGLEREMAERGVPVVE